MAPSAGDGRPPWADRITAELHAADRRARALAAGFTPQQMDWKPSADRWSIGQCLAHLIAANEVYLPPMEDALRGRPASPVQAISPGWFGRWFIRSVIEPSPTTQKARAPRKIEPKPSSDPDVLESFLRSNDDARDLVDRAAGYDVNRIRFKNPFVPFLRFTVGTGLEIIWKHEVRHLIQAERVRSAPGFPEVSER